MKTRPFGKTGLEVTPIGLGTAELAIDGLSQDHADGVLNAALDAGINLIDTAECYGDSEAKIGIAISSRRDEFVLVTKCGHKAGLTSEEWTPAIIGESLDRSLKRLRTDHVDVLLLHSCGREKLHDQEMLQALERCKQSGKTRLVGYSGDNEEAEEAVGMGLFDVLETSLNICDQQGLKRFLPRASRRGMGVLVKRPLANGCWRRQTDFQGFYADYARPYIQRLQAMQLSPLEVGFDGTFPEMALRFSAYAAGASAVVIGTTKINHIRSDIEILEQGPLPANVFDNIRKIWQRHDSGAWVGQT